jgi:hypothetical protein
MVAWSGQAARAGRLGGAGQSTTSCTLHDSQGVNVNKQHWDSAVVVVEDCRFARLQIDRQRACSVGATPGARVSLGGHPMRAEMVLLPLTCRRPWNHDERADGGVQRQRPWSEE